MSDSSPDPIPRMPFWDAQDGADAAAAIRRIVAARTPVVLVGSPVTEWPALTRWAPKRLAEALPTPETAYLRDWLAAGYGGEMHYIERRVEERVDPRAVLEGARSIVSVGLLYSPGNGEEAPAADSAGRIARYAGGDDSGVGSYGEFAAFKGEVLNDLVREQRVESVIEFGCGDGNQLSLAAYPRYLGLDVSPTAVARCRDRFAHDATKSFRLMSEYDDEIADLALSLSKLYAQRGERREARRILEVTARQVRGDARLGEALKALDDTY